jgi:hypothetical protein
MSCAARIWFNFGLSICGLTFVALASARQYNYTSFHKIIQCEAPDGLFIPSSSEDVISIVKQAAAAKQNIRVITANKWSITDVLCASLFRSLPHLPTH